MKLHFRILKAISLVDSLLLLKHHPLQHESVKECDEPMIRTSESDTGLMSPTGLGYDQQHSKLQVLGQLLESEASK